MSEPTELPPELYAEITYLSDCGNAQMDAENYEQALADFEQALQKVPSPKNNWVASTWLYAAIGDACFHLRRFQQAKDAFQNAAGAIDGSGNPFVQLRLGQSCLELGEDDDARRHLTLAYAIEGEEIFAEEDPRYQIFLNESQSS